MYVLYMFQYALMSRSRVITKPEALHLLQTYLVEYTMLNV